MTAAMGVSLSPEVFQFAALIREQADAELQQIARDAEQRAQRLRATAEAEVTAIDAEARRDGAERGRRQAAALLAEAETRGQREWLWARERLLANVLARVEAELAALPVRPDTAERLARLVDEAVAVLPREPVRVRVAANCVALVEAALKARAAGGRPYRVEASSVTDTLATGAGGAGAGGGVIVETEDGRLCFDNSFATRIRLQGDELRGAAAAILFAE